MFSASLLAALTAALSFFAGDQQSPNPDFMLRVSTPTYFADGQVLGATSAGFPLQMNQPIVLYAYSGRTLCLSHSARPGMPSDAGYGWRVQIVPIRNTDGLVLQVEWQRMWDRGEMLGVTLGAATRGSALVTLHPGDHVLFAYLSAAEQPAAGAATDLTQNAATPACHAVGMGLEVGLQPIEGRALVEANLWLVRTLPDGTERSQRQTIRARLGTTVDYYFDDITFAPTPEAAARAGAAPGERSVHTFGRISPIKIEDGKVRMDLMIAQEFNEGAPPSLATAGSSTFPLTAGPDEVLSFQVPRVAVGAGLGERLAVRVQVRQIR
jgi:hypothetical protein